MHYNNDGGHTFGGKTDHGWTGGGIFGHRYTDDGEAGYVECGFQAFTGTILGRDSRHPGDGESADGYYDQLPNQLSLNRADWFFRQAANHQSNTLSISSSPAFNVQNMIHDHVAETAARFEFSESRKSSGSDFSYP